MSTPNFARGKVRLSDLCPGREVADRPDDVPGKSENAGKGGIFPERNEMDFIIPAQDFLLRRDQESAVEIIYSGAIAVKGRRPEEDGNVHFMGELQDAVLEGEGALKKKWGGRLRPDDQIRVLGLHLTGQIRIDSYGFLLELGLPFDILADIALDQSDEKRLFIPGFFIKLHQSPLPVDGGQSQDDPCGQQFLQNRFYLPGSDEAATRRYREPLTSTMMKETP